MFLRELELLHVRSIEAARISFDGADGEGRRWTLLLGENGAGKSTVLRAIALLMAGSEALPELLGSPDQWIRNGYDSCAIRGTLATAEGEPRSIELTLQRGDNLRAVFARNEATLDALDRALRHSSRNYLCVGYGVNRRPARGFNDLMMAAELFQHPRSRSVGTLFAPDAPLYPLETWAMDVDYRDRQEGLEVVSATLADLLPGVTFHGIDRERRQLLFETPDGVVPFRQLSEGYQSMAAWTGDLVYRMSGIYANYKRPLTGRGVLLVDEVDLHLHPIWQRELRQFLIDKLPHLQIIATTNSPLTAQQCGPGELYVLHRERSAHDQGRTPAVLTPFEGTPRRMGIQEVLMSPLFGLGTIESLEWEHLREEYVHLETKRRLTAREQRRLEELRRELEPAGAE